MARKQRLAGLRRRGARLVKWISIHTGKRFQIAGKVARQHRTVKVAVSLRGAGLLGGILA